MSIRLAKFRSRTGKKSDVKKEKVKNNTRSVPNRNHRNGRNFEEVVEKDNLIGDDSETSVAESDSF